MRIRNGKYYVWRVGHGAGGIKKFNIELSQHEEEKRGEKNKNKNKKITTPPCNL